MRGARPDFGRDAASGGGPAPAKWAAALGFTVAEMSMEAATRNKTAAGQQHLSSPVTDVPWGTELPAFPRGRRRYDLRLFRCAVDALPSMYAADGEMSTILCVHFCPKLTKGL